MSDHPLILHVPEALDHGELQPGQTAALGLYEVQQAAGEDRHVKVYRAWDTVEGIPVALNLLSEGLAATEPALRELAGKIEAIHEKAHPTFITPYHVVAFPNRTLVVEEWLHEIKLLNLMRSRGSLPLSEAMPILAALADGVDFAISQFDHPFDLTLRHVLLTFPQEDAFGEGRVATEIRVKDWPAYRVKINPLSLAPASKVREPLNRAFGKLFYQTLGGRVQRYGSHAYVPLPQLSEEGNTILRRFLSAGDSDESCAEVLKKVAGAESIAWDEVTPAMETIDLPARAESLRAQIETKRARIETVLEERRLEEERRLAEAQRLEEERLRQEEARLKEEERREEERRRQEEARLEEERRQEEERRRQEEVRRLEEQARQEELARQEEELRRQEEELRLQEERRREEERLKKEELRRKQEELRRQQEAFRLEEERRVQEERRLEEEEALRIRRAEEEAARAEHEAASFASPTIESEPSAAGLPSPPVPLEETPEPSRPLPVTQRSKLLAGSLAALLLAAAGTYFFIKLVLPGPVTEPISIEIFQENLSRLLATEDWPALYGQIPEILAASFEPETESGLLETARTALAPLFTESPEWPAPETVRQLDPGSRQAVREILAAQIRSSAGTPMPVDELSRLLSYAHRAWPGEPLAELANLAASRLAAFQESLGRGEILTEAQAALVGELAAQDVPGAAEIQESSRALAVTLQNQEALEQSRQEARRLFQEEDWEALFEKLEAYASVPGDEAGELQKLADASVAPLYQNLANAPAPEAVAGKSPRTKQLVGQALASLARDQEDPALLHPIYQYANRIQAPTPDPDLLALGETAASALASRGDSGPLAPEERALLESLASYGVPEAASLKSRLAAREASQREALADWEAFSSELEAARDGSNWLQALALLDDPRVTPELREDSAIALKLDETGRAGAEALAGTPSELPVGEALRSLGPHARRHLLAAAAAAGQAAAQRGDAGRLIAYLEWNRTELPDGPIADLASAADALAGELARAGRSSENQAALETLAALGSSRAGDALQGWRLESEREARFEAALTETRALAARGAAQPLIDQLEGYLDGQFTATQETELLALARPAVTARYARLENAPPPRTVGDRPEGIKTLVSQEIERRAEAAVSAGDLSEFQGWLGYQRIAFGGPLPAAWQSLGARAVEALKQNGAERNRTSLKELSDRGVDAASRLLEEMKGLQEQQQWARERTEALALASSDPGEALNRFLAFKRTHCDNDGRRWKETYASDIDGILASIKNAKGLETTLAALAKERFPRAQHLLNELNKAEPDPNAEPETVADFRRLFPSKQKDTKFVAAYMRALQKEVTAGNRRSGPDLETLALHALNIGMVDAGFSTLDSLYTTQTVRPSANALRQIPKEFGGLFSDHKAARKGWEGIWMMRGHPPYHGGSVAERHRRGVELLREAAPDHSYSKTFLSGLRPR